MLASATNPVKKITRAPRLREATFDDYSQIALLESNYGLGSGSHEQWTHLWRENPLYRQRRADWPIGWVLEDENRQVVGSMGNIPLPYEIGGKSLIASSGRAWVCQPAYRSTSLLLLDRVIYQPGIDLYVNNTMTREAEPSIQVFDCPRVPCGQWNVSAFWITHHHGFLRSYLSRKNVRMAGLLSLPLGAASFLKDKISSRRIRGAAATVRATDTIDRRFDQFWDAYRAANPAVLLAVRSREMLEWHFAQRLQRGKLWLATLCDGARILAYAVFDRRDNRELGLKRMRLVDFVSLEPGDELLRPILAWALEKCHREGVHMLENTGRWLDPGELIDRLAPHRRELSGWTYYYRASTPRLKEALRDRAAWKPALYDGNASL
jgi:hypothetical protein